MAGDTREPTSSKVPSPSGKDTSKTKTMEIFNPPSDPKAEHKPQATVTEAVKSIKLSDFKELHKIPGVRESLLYGIGAGFVIGGGRFLFGNRNFALAINSAANWAVGSFLVTSTGYYEYTCIMRRLEKQNMRRVVEVMDKAREEKRRERERQMEKQRSKEEEERKAEEARRSWKNWKRWLW